MIKENIQGLKREISTICRGLGKNPEEITLVAVTKNATVEQIREAIDNGITGIGENRVQEAGEKYSLLKSSALKFHLVGHLQTNKVKQALEIFDLIHSLDSLRLAQEIDRAAGKSGRQAECLVQVNVSGEKSKFGIDPAGAAGFLEAIGNLKFLQVKGLMAIAPLTGDTQTIRSCFRGLRLLKDDIAANISLPNIEMKYLSMGMSDDYRIALEEGSNMLRIGRAIFEDK